MKTCISITCAGFPSPPPPARALLAASGPCIYLSIYIYISRSIYTSYAYKNMDIYITCAGFPSRPPPDRAPPSASGPSSDCEIYIYIYRNRMRIKTCTYISHLSRFPLTAAPRPRAAVRLRSQQRLGEGVGVGDLSL